VCLCVFVCLCVCVYIYIYIYIYRYVRTSVCVCICIHTHVCAYVCVWCGRIYGCVRVYAYVCRSKCANMHMYAHACMQCMSTHAFISTHKERERERERETSQQEGVQMYAHTCMHAHYVYTYTNIYIHTQANTHAPHSKVVRNRHQKFRDFFALALAGSLSCRRDRLLELLFCDSIKQKLLLDLLLCERYGVALVLVAQLQVRNHCHGREQKKSTSNSASHSICRVSDGAFQSRWCDELTHRAGALLCSECSSFW
jgi:hypothetical protein